VREDLSSAHVKAAWVDGGLIFRAG
jgi:hypothetical protein